MLENGETVLTDPLKKKNKQEVEKMVFGRIKFKDVEKALGLSKGWKGVDVDSIFASLDGHFIFVVKGSRQEIRDKEKRVKKFLEEALRVIFSP